MTAPPLLNLTLPYPINNTFIPLIYSPLPPPPHFNPSIWYVGFDSGDYFSYPNNLNNYNIPSSSNVLPSPPLLYHSILWVIQPYWLLILQWFTIQFLIRIANYYQYSTFLLPYEISITQAENDAHTVSFIHYPSSYFKDTLLPSYFDIVFFIPIIIQFITFFDNQNSCIQYTSSYNAYFTLSHPLPAAYSCYNLLGYRIFNWSLLAICPNFLTILVKRKYLKYYTSGWIGEEGKREKRGNNKNKMGNNNKDNDDKSTNDVESQSKTKNHHPKIKDNTREDDDSPKDLRRIMWQEWKWKIVEESEISSSLPSSPSTSTNTNIHQTTSIHSTEEKKEKDDMGLEVKFRPSNSSSDALPTTLSSSSSSSNFSMSSSSLSSSSQNNAKGIKKVILSLQNHLLSYYQTIKSSLLFPSLPPHPPPSLFTLNSLSFPSPHRLLLIRIDETLMWIAWNVIEIIYTLFFLLLITYALTNSVPMMIVMPWLPLFVFLPLYVFYRFLTHCVDSKFSILSNEEKEKQKNYQLKYDLSLLEFEAETQKQSEKVLILMRNFVNILMENDWSRIKMIVSLHNKEMIVNNSKDNEENEKKDNGYQALSWSLLLTRLLHLRSTYPSRYSAAYTSMLYELGRLCMPLAYVEEMTERMKGMGREYEGRWGVGGVEGRIREMVKEEEREKEEREKEKEGGGDEANNLHPPSLLSIPSMTRESSANGQQHHLRSHRQNLKRNTTFNTQANGNGIGHTDGTNGNGRISTTGHANYHSTDEGNNNNNNNNNNNPHRDTSHHLDSGMGMVKSNTIQCSIDLFGLSSLFTLTAPTDSSSSSSSTSSSTTAHQGVGEDTLSPLPTLSSSVFSSSTSPFTSTAPSPSSSAASLPPDFDIFTPLQEAEFYATRLVISNRLRNKEELESSLRMEKPVYRPVELKKTKVSQLFIYNCSLFFIPLCLQILYNYSQYYFYGESYQGTIEGDLRARDTQKWIALLKLSTEQGVRTALSFF